MKFREIALQMLFAAERVSPAHTALEYAKEVFHVVCGEARSVHVFAAVMLERLMIAKFLAESEAMRSPIPTESGHPIRSKATT